MEKSIKDSKRRRPIKVDIFNNNTPLMLEMGHFWASNNNKLKTTYNCYSIKELKQWQ